MIAYNARARRFLILGSALFLVFGVHFLIVKDRLLYGSFAPLVAAATSFMVILPLVLWWKHRRLWTALNCPTELRFSPEDIPVREDGTYLGEGFTWQAHHTRRFNELSLAETEAGDQSHERLGGSWKLHGIGADSYRNLYLPNSLLNQHLYVLGAPGTGKSRFLELLIDQAIRRGDAVVVIDPKGDERLLDRTYDSAVRAGKGGSFRFFGLPYPYQSVRYNPLRSFVQVNEVTDRVAMVLPKGGGDVEAFRNFAWDFVNTVATGLKILAKPITVADLRTYCLHDREFLVRQLLHHYYPSIDTTGKSLTPAIKEYRKKSDAQGHGILELDQLIKMSQVDEKHFDKISSALKPVFAKLLSPGVGYLLCPGRINSLVSTPDPEDESTPPETEELSWSDIDERKQIVYFFLGSMIGPDTASGVAKMALADLQAFIGRKYAYSPAKDFRRITVIVDEAGDVLSDSTVNLLNKARGASLSLCLCFQSLSDIESALGKAADANRVLGNLATFVTLRAENPEDALFFSNKCGDHPQLAISEGDSYEPALWQSARSNIDDFAYRSSRTVSTRTEPLVPPYLPGHLARFHFMVLHSGEVAKGILPFLDDPHHRYSDRLKEPAA